MSKMTEGPWVAEKVRQDETDNFEWMISTRAPIVEGDGCMLLPNDDFFIAEFYGPDAEDNAKACGALPEIAEAIERTIADIRLFSNSFDNGSASKDFCIGVENRLCSALNKAKGKDG